MYTALTQRLPGVSHDRWMHRWTLSPRALGAATCLSYYKNNPSNTLEIMTTLKIPIIIG